MASQRSLVRRAAGFDEERKRRELERELDKQDLGPVLNFIKGIQDYSKKGSKSKFPFITFYFLVFTIGLIIYFVVEGGKE